MLGKGFVEGGGLTGCATTQQIDLIHCRVTSIPALRLERFKQLEVRFGGGIAVRGVLSWVGC